MEKRIWVGARMIELIDVIDEIRFIEVELRKSV